MRAPLFRALIAALLAGAPAVADDATIADLERSGATVQRADATGLGRFVSAPAGIGLGGGTRAAGPASGARAFLDRFGGAFGLGGRVGVRTVRSGGRDLVGMEHVRLQQQLDGVPVAGGEMTVHLRDGAVTAVLARTVGDLDRVALTPAVGADSATAAARLLAAAWPESQNVAFSTPRLELFNRALLTGEGTADTRLAWFIEAESDVRQQYIWIDAVSGALLYDFNQRPTARVRQVWDANNAPMSFGTLLRTEGGPPTGNAQVDAAYDYAGHSYDYFFTEHGRDSYDGAGGTLVNVVRACPNDLCFGLCPCPNAFNALLLVYLGDGWATDDIVVHEWTHSVTNYSAGLLYQKQSGALNESFSDIFGEIVDLTNGAGTDTPAVRWRVAEDLNGSGIRDMLNPTSMGDPGKVSDPQVVCASFDNYGVHYNSGIPNHAFALMVDGGTYNGFTIAGIGLTKAGKIQYRALDQYLVASSTLLDNYDALTQACADLIGTAGITGADCVEVGKALDAVEMDGPWPCPTDPPTPTPTVTATPTSTPTVTETPTPVPACPPAPRGACRAAGTAKLIWTQAGGADDKLLVKLIKAPSTTVGELANPIAGADYALCLYAGGAPLAQLEVPGHGTRWKATGKGFAYKDAAGSAAGVTKMVLKASTTGTTKLLLKGAAANLPDPVFGSLATPIHAQIANLATGVCWEGVFDSGDVGSDTAGLLKAKATN